MSLVKRWIPLAAVHYKAILLLVSLVTAVAVSKISDLNINIAAESMMTTNASGQSLL